MDNESGMEEERRLCYVGMTRAREKLILTGAAYRVLYGRGEYTRESTFLRELDKSLLVGICEDDRITSLYQSIVAALQNMGYAVIAEGVETPKELGLVSRWGVNLIQGYYFSRPLPGEALLSAVLDREGAAPATR